MFNNKLTLAIALATGASVIPSIASAMPVNGTGELVSEVIFGSGNFDGAFTGVNTSTESGGADNSATAGVELGLRGKLRYNNATPPAPESTYNYDGVDTYTFSSAEGNPPAGRSIFNIDWSVNSDPNGAGGTDLDSYIFGLFFDYDPSAAQSFALIDFVFPGLYRDHAFGTNTTAQGGGAVAPGGDVPAYNALYASSNVAQNSWNAGFGAPPGFDPQTPGTFSAQLAAFSATDPAFEEIQPGNEASFLAAFNQADPLATASIDIVVSASSTDVPAPAPLALLALGLSALGAGSLRRKTPA